MRSAAIPYDQVAWFSADLLPLESVVLEPLHATVGETEPLGRPGGDARLVGHLFVELLRYDMAALARNEASIIGSARIQVHEALEAAEAGFGWVLVLMRPRFAA